MNAILQDIQVHPVSDKILHIDFFELKDDKEIIMEVPVKISGTSPGVLLGGVLNLNQRRLKVKALPKNLPDFVEANISELQMGNKLYVTKLATKQLQIDAPRQYSSLPSEDFSCSYESSSRSCKSRKNSYEKEKIIFLSSISKHFVSARCFFYYLKFFIFGRYPIVSRKMTQYGRAFRLSPRTSFQSGCGLPLQSLTRATQTVNQNNSNPCQS